MKRSHFRNGCKSSGRRISMTPALAFTYSNSLFWKGANISTGINKGYLYPQLPTDIVYSRAQAFDNNGAEEIFYFANVINCPQYVRRIEFFCRTNIATGDTFTLTLYSLNPGGNQVLGTITGTSTDVWTKFTIYGNWRREQFCCLAQSSAMIRVGFFVGNTLANDAYVYMMYMELHES